MTEEEINVFVEATSNYLSQNGELKVKLSTPYLSTDPMPLEYDYTGLIAISGDYKGCVYVTAPQAMLRHLMMHMGETECTEDDCLDMVGEVANTLSGNARRHYGERFVISVPISIKGKLSQIRVPKDIRPYVVPMKWQSYKAALVICVEQA